MRSVGAIIQARLHSERLANKVMLPIGGRTVIGWVIMAAQQAQRVDHITVTTPDQELMRYCQACAEGLASVQWWRCQRDTLSEFYTLATAFNYDIIVRLTADCPMLQSDHIDQTIEQFLDSDVEYVYSNTDGADVEVFGYDSLVRAYGEAGQDQREHVTTWLRENLKCEQLEPFPGEYVSLDTWDNYEAICRLLDKRSGES